MSTIEKVEVYVDTAKPWNIGLTFGRVGAQRRGSLMPHYFTKPVAESTNGA